MKKKSFWRGVGVSALFVMLFFAVQSILSIPISFIGTIMILVQDPNAFGDMTDPMAMMSSAAFGELTLWAMLISEALTVLGIFIAYLIKKKNPFKQLEINAISPVTAILSVIAAVAMCIAVEFALAMLPISQDMFDTFDQAFEGIYKSPYWMIILAVGIIGPICEEVIFRGGVMNAMRRECNPAVGIIISGVVFGLMHGIPLQIMYATVIGLVLGLVFHLTKSLWTVIIIHIVNNIFTNYTASIFTGWENPVIVLSISVAVTILCIVLMGVIERKRRYSVEYRVETEEAEVVAEA